MKSVSEAVVHEVSIYAPGAKHLLVAVSGGADSVALLRILAETDYALSVAHVDHQLRDASAADAAFVAQLAAQLGLPIYQTQIDVASIATAKGWNLEDGARRLRYSYLSRTAKQVGADCIVTAHTQDDQAETVLMQLLRGAAFLKGMSVTQKQVVRPLLGVSKRELLALLELLRQPYCEDVTNQDTRLTRAWLRHTVIPLLQARYPHIHQLLARLATMQQTQADYLNRQANPLLRADGVVITELQRQHRAVQQQVIAELIRREDQPVTQQALETLLALLDSTSPKRVSLSDTHSALVAYGQLSVVPRYTEPLSVEPVTKIAQLPPEVMSEVLNVYSDLVYRSRQPGDTIRLSGGTKKLSDLLIDRKIPRETRDSVRLLAADSEVIWVEGLATDVRFAKAKVPNDDEALMRQALQLAQQAFDKGELPVGALIVRDRVVIASAHNETECTRDPAAHAEVLAVRRAAAALGDWRLTGCTLYVTLEPCLMCLGAMLQAHLPKLVYGADNLREGALGSVASVHTLPWKRKVDVTRGVLAKECGEVLQTFFQSRR